MNIEEFRNYCITKKGVTEELPFDNNTLVFKVMGKMFALSSLKGWEEGTESVNLKCDPERALELRAEFQSINPGYHMNKKHWNTVQLHNGELSDAFTKELIDHSYESVISALTKKLKDELNNI